MQRRNSHEREKQTFEQEIARLEEIVAALEKGDAPLADSLALFEGGDEAHRRLLQGAGPGGAEGGQADEGPRRAPVELPFGEEAQA